MRRYGCYDINGCRFRSETYEHTRAALATTNCGVCVSSYDENDNILEYYGVIKDIIKVSWEGSMRLEVVIFECDWFDPTPAGVRRTENLGLVEVKHSSRLTNFEPFVLASQVKQSKYIIYHMLAMLDKIYLSGGLCTMLHREIDCFQLIATRSLMKMKGY